MMDVGAHMSACVEKWTSTGSVHSRHSKVSCLFLEQPQSCSVSQFLGIDVTREAANTHTVHYYTCAGVETELAPLQKPFI